MLRFFGIFFFCGFDCDEFVLSQLIDSLLTSQHIFSLGILEVIKCLSDLRSFMDANTFLYHPQRF